MADLELARCENRRGRQRVKEKLVGAALGLVEPFSAGATSTMRRVQNHRDSSLLPFSPCSQAEAPRSTTIEQKMEAFKHTMGTEHSRIPKGRQCSSNATTVDICDFWLELSSSFYARFATACFSPNMCLYPTPRMEGSQSRLHVSLSLAIKPELTP